MCRKSLVNGRQILDIDSSVQALSTVKNEKLTAKHLQNVYEATIDILKDLLENEEVST